jgi:hypothetical protein
MNDALQSMVISAFLLQPSNVVSRWFPPGSTLVQGPMVSLSTQGYRQSTDTPIKYTGHYRSGTYIRTMYTYF